eukprot:4223093-Ditylum_brightwellii.AAC.1
MEKGNGFFPICDVLWVVGRKVCSDDGDFVLGAMSGDMCRWDVKYLLLTSKRARDVDSRTESTNTTL